MSLSFDLVVQTFHLACYGQNAISQQNAMKNIQEMETGDDIIPLLIMIIEQSTNWKMEMRLLSSISLKNIVSKRWISRGKNVSLLKDEDKAFLKTFLLSYLYDPENKILLQLAICAGKIARYDWPEKWPSLFQDLFEIYELNKSGLFKQRRTLYILHECFRELNEKNMPQTKFALAKSSVSIFNFIYPIWSDFCKILIDRLDGGVSYYENIDYILEHVYINTRILRKSMERGYIEIDSSSTINVGYFYSQFVSYFEKLTFIVSSFQQRQNCNNSHISGNEYFFNSIELHEFDINDDIFSFQVDKSQSYSSSHYIGIAIIPALIRLVKDMTMIPTVLQKEYPLEIGRYLAAFLEFYRKQLFQQYNYPENRIPTTTEMMSIKLDWNQLNYSLCTSAVVFLSNSISCQKYVNLENETRIGCFEESYEISKGSEIIENSDNNKSLHIASVTRNTFYCDDAVLSFLTLCIHRLLRYSPSELEESVLDPEQFFLSQQDLSEENNLKTASEAFFLGLLDKSPDLVCNFLMSFLQDSETQYQMISSHCNEDLILFYNSVYLCAGLAASTLSQCGHTIDWIANIIGPILSALLQNGATLTKTQILLKTRLLWLLSCFMYQFNSHIISDIMNLISVALSSSHTDIVCLLTAIETLQSVLKCDIFQSSIHENYLPPISTMLCVTMTQRLSENEAKQICVNVLGDLVDFMNKSHLVSMLNDFWNCFSYMWKFCVSFPSDPLKASVIETLTKIISCAGSEAHTLEMYNVTFPMLYEALSGTIESSYLVRDGISLWLCLARSIPLNSYSQRFNDLYNARYFSLFENDIFGDNYEDMKDIMLISEAQIISGGNWFFADCVLQFQKVYSKILCKSPPRIVPYVIRPIECSLVVCPAEALGFLIDSGFLFEIARTCSASIPSLSTVLSEYVEVDVALISYLSILARLCLLAPNSLKDVSEIVARCIGCGIANGNFDFPNTSTTQFHQSDADMILYGWLRLFVDKFDSVGYSSGGIWRRRLWIFALLSLYPNHDTFLLDMFPEVVNIAIDVTNEERDENINQEKASKIVDMLISKEEDMSGWIDASSASAGISSENLADAPNPTNVGEKESIFYAYAPYIINDAVTQSSVFELAKEKLRVMNDLFQGTNFRQQLDLIVGDTALKIFV